jgi:ATP adenylyltransferase/5',5'''-P-1,P-4-tetraphosphate phosphorylase II
MKMVMTLSEIVDSFIAEQLAEWQTAADNFAALKHVKVKGFDVDGMPVKVQFNPARIVSSAAKVDAKSLSERKCFLCADNRPSQQQGIEWGRYTILINPFPIFPRHLTIPDNTHTDQRIAGRIADMARLAQGLQGYTVFYNGPKCGASAPDHMHFQAGNTDFLTLPDVVLSAEREVVARRGCGTLSLINSLPLKMFVINAMSAQVAAELFDTLYAALPMHQGEAEPMMNVLCFAAQSEINVVVIPRKRHRPSFYGTEGADTMLLSPASVDMGGVFITPLEKDFNNLDADVVRRVYDELCMSADDVSEIIEKIKKQQS